MTVAVGIDEHVASGHGRTIDDAIGQKLKRTQGLTFAANDAIRVAAIDLDSNVGEWFAKDGVTDSS